MPEQVPLRQPLLEQAEEIYFEHERQKLRAQIERESARDLQRSARRARFCFLKACNAIPWDVSEYEAWLKSYVNHGNAIEEYRVGAFPRPLQDQQLDTPLMAATRRAIGIDFGSLEEDYYESAVIWHVSDPMTFDELPKVAGDHCALSLHLSERALMSFDEGQLPSLDSSSSLHLYMDGRWEDGRWIEQPHIWNAVASVWAENLENLRASVAEELR